jgi:hypothetical protein
MQLFLGQNPDKSFKSFPLCYSKSPLQLCLEISISSNFCSFYSALVYTVKEKGGKPDRKPHPLHMLWEVHTEALSLKTLNGKFMNSASEISCTMPKYFKSIRYKRPEYSPKGGTGISGSPANALKIQKNQNPFRAGFNAAPARYTENRTSTGYTVKKGQQFSLPWPECH